MFGAISSLGLFVFTLMVQSRLGFFRFVALFWFRFQSHQAEQDSEWSRLEVFLAGRRKVITNSSSLCRPCRAARTVDWRTRASGAVLPDRAIISVVVHMQFINTAKYSHARANENAGLFERFSEALGSTSKGMRGFSEPRLSENVALKNTLLHLV